MIAYLHPVLFWKQWLVFAYATFLEIVICILLQLSIVEIDWMETNWVLASFVVWIILICLFLYLMIVLFCVVWPKYYKKGRTRALKREYGVLVAILRKRRGSWSMLFHVTYFTRRIALAIVTIYWNKHPMF